MNPLTLYLVVYDDDDGENQDWFVTATNHLEAFTLWRIAREYNPQDFAGDDREATVHVVPTAATVPTVHDWFPQPNEWFRLDLVNLTTMAIEANAKATKVKEST